VRGFWRGPPPQEHIQTDEQVNQRDQPQAVVERFIGGNGNQRHIQLHAIAHYCVHGFGINPLPVNLLHALGTVADVDM